MFIFIPESKFYHDVIVPNFQFHVLDTQVKIVLSDSQYQMLTKSDYLSFKCTK